MNFKIAKLLLTVSGLLLALSATANTFELTGELKQGALLRGLTSPGATVLHDGEPIRVSPAGVFLIGFHRDAAVDSILQVRFPDGTEQTQPLAIESRRYNIERIDGLAPKKVTPPKEVLDRIAREVALVKQARKRDDTRTDFLTGFKWPLIGRISGVYGSQRVLNGEPKRPHFGIDIAAPAGSPVTAPADGLVIVAHPDMYYSGATLIIDHGHGLSSAFLHLKSIVVKQGERVRQGQKIAEVGSSGRSTGPHLDWRINLFDKRLDPALVAGPMPK